MTTLQGKRILLIVGGGIAAYKSLELVRALKRRDAAVRCVMTRAAGEFVTALSLASLSGDKVYDDLFSLTDEATMGHIELSRDADLLVVAPATADLIARMANGLANDLASTVLLATDKRVLLAPAMNVRMWHHAATRRNLARLKDDGILFVGPGEGEMACGEFGLGRMAEPAEIVEAVETALKGATVLPFPQAATGMPKLDAPRRARALQGRHVLITAGPTQEAIDPVRFIANRSSGKQGYALALAAASAGARVTLVTGPVEASAPPGCTLVKVTTALEMAAAVNAALPADVAIFAAAVADWRVADVHPDKMKKTGQGPPELLLVENPDILADVAHRVSGRPALVIGFAAETSEVLANAQAKLARKGCDLIVANDVSAAGGVMGGDRNTVHIVEAFGVENWPTLTKTEVAERLVALVARRLEDA